MKTGLELLWRVWSCTRLHELGLNFYEMEGRHYMMLFRNKEYTHHHNWAYSGSGIHFNHYPFKPAYEGVQPPECHPSEDNRWRYVYMDDLFFCTTCQRFHPYQDADAADPRVEFLKALGEELGCEFAEFVRFKTRLTVETVKSLVADRLQVPEFRHKPCDDTRCIVDSLKDWTRVEHDASLTTIIVTRRQAAEAAWRRRIQPPLQTPPAPESPNSNPAAVLDAGAP